MAHRHLHHRQTPCDEVDDGCRHRHIYEVEDGEIVEDAPVELYEAHVQKSSNDYDASDLHDQRKLGKRHRVSSSHDDEEGHVNKLHRGRWRSESILEECHGQGDGERYKSNLDDDKIGHFRDYEHGNQESSREHKSSYRRRDIEKERERERERGRERKREKAQYGEQEYERERDRERYTLGEKEERGRRNRDRESRGPSREDRDRYSDRSSRKRRRSDDHNVDDHAYHRRNRHHETDIVRDRTADLLKAEKQKTAGTESEKLKRDEVEQEDYQEKIAFQLAQQEKEEEELERIKEESRRRRQAILEKYKNQPSQKVQVTQSGDNAEVHAEAAGDSVVPEPIDGPTSGADVHVDESTFSAGKLPLRGGHNADEKASGQGNPEFPTKELAKELAKQIECLQQHQQEYKDRVKQQSERSADMFCDDIFGESPADIRKMGKGDGLPIERGCLHDNWDDPEGYYRYRFGEILDDRYEILAAHGKGVFSTVVRAKDLKARSGHPEEVAIKIIRNNETMYKAGLEELVILKKLIAADPKDKRRCVRLISSFKYRNHLCLVFESLCMNLRSLQKKLGRNIGLSLSGVKCFAGQLFSALKHLKSCSVLHCDIKPDNILVNEARTVLKLCDFGNAMFAGKNEITPYLVSRFYRAPEIILGLPYDHPMDIWSVGCCLFELYAGKILFPGRSNNDMLRLHMELKGPFPKKMLRKGAFTYQHFDHDLNFLATEEDPITKKAIGKRIVNIKPKDISSVISGDSAKELKMLAHFKDLMERIFVLDPLKRITVSQALEHPFIMNK